MKFAKVLVAVDFSDSSRAALEVGDSLAAAEATLILLHVNAAAALLQPELGVVISGDELVRISVAAREQVGTWAKQARTPPERRRVEVVQGDPVEQLIRWSEEVDLIVMGTHGRKGLNRFMLGSVAERVVRGAKCSVLVVRPRAR